MTILWPDAIPAPGAGGWQFSIVATTTQSPASRFTGRRQTAYRYRRWSAQASWPVLVGDEARAAEALLDEMNGRAGRLMMPVWHRIPPRGIIGNAPWQLTGNLGQRDVTITGFDNNQAAAVAMGDFISFAMTNGRHVLHRVTAAANANRAGSAAVNLSAPLRGDCTAVQAELKRPVCRMMLTADNAAQLRWRNANEASLTISLIEEPY